MNKWLSHYLYDVDNGIENMPTVSVQSNVDGSFRTYDTWGDFDFDTFAYDKTVNPDDVSHVDTTAIGTYYYNYKQATDEFGNALVRDNYYLSLPDSACAVYEFDVPDNYTFYGVPEVHLKLSTKNVDRDSLVISALLIDTIDGETGFKAFLTKGRLNNRLPKHTLGEVETGGGLKRTKVIEYVKSNATAKLITFGHGDLANYGGGYDGKDYTKPEEPMKAGEYYDYTLYLQPTSYTFEHGHKAVLVITGWDPYLSFRDMDLRTGAVSDSTESRDIYAFNIDNSAFELRFPQEKGSSAAFEDEPSESKVMIPFRFASKDEGTDLMLSNKAYYAKFSPNKLGYVIQKNDATMEEYLDFAREQVLDWTDEEKDVITRGMKVIEDRFMNNGWTMPPLDTIIFIKTSMMEENGVSGYTHGTQIYLYDFMNHYSSEAFADGQIPDSFVMLLSHELFHCLTRCNPDFRAEMYSLIGFTVEEEDFEIPPSVWEYYIVNPDVEHHNSRATFKINGQEIDCFAAFVTTKHFEQPGEEFFQFGTTALVPVDGSDVFYPKDEVSNFDEVFGTNSGYVIDPEECMADNFKFAVLYGLDGPDGDGYPNPEIIEGIIDILSR